MLARLSYGDTATVRVTNRGRRRRKDPSDLGYWLDTVKGYWLSEKAAEDSSPEDDALDDASKGAVEPEGDPVRRGHSQRRGLPSQRTGGAEVATSLRYALERGIEAAFQLEDSELSSEELPDLSSQGRMLFTESSEGGAGVLRRLQAERDALATAAREALRIAHFDPDTGDDLHHAEGARERCEKACYDCLLSYGNQFDHESIDRHAIKDLLMKFATASTVTGGAAESRQAQIDRLLAQCTSSLEELFIKTLAEGDYALPDEAQVLLADQRVRPDFVFRSRDGSTAIFVDGPTPRRCGGSERDAGAEDRLMDAGWSVLRFRYDGDWIGQVRERVDVFGDGRS